MITHRHPSPERPSRVVVLGAAGFVGAASVRHLKAAGIETLGLGKTDVDLLGPGAPAALASRLRAGDALVFISARAPCRDAAQLARNTEMAESVCAAIRDAALSHLIYVSSDAVYADSDRPLTEASPAVPESIHGTMHLTREKLLATGFDGPFAILRPTLLYGLDDPHNGYGPNRFRRLAASGEDIVLFGEGEERRDHVHVEDMGEVVARVVLHGSTGILNVASGEVASFRDLAELTAGQFTPRVKVRGSPRSGPMPHNGYRGFDTAALKEAFPGLLMAGWREGVARVCRAAAGKRSS